MLLVVTFRYYHLSCFFCHISPSQQIAHSQHTPIPLSLTLSPFRPPTMPKRAVPAAVVAPITALQPPPPSSPLIQRLRTDWRWAGISQFLWMFSDAFGFVDWDIEVGLPFLTSLPPTSPQSEVCHTRVRHASERSLQSREKVRLT